MKVAEESFINGSSSSSSSSRLIHVYLSFRGDDETCRFTDSLWAALETDDLNTFWDDKKLDPGDSFFLPRHFHKAIRQSNISIVVFSKSYASSIWCLEELSEIAARIHEPRYTVFPIFYGVDPSEVQNQSNSFEIAFTGLEQRFAANSRMVHSWRLAMKQVANLSGWHVPSDSLPQVIDDIVRGVKKKVRELVYVDADLVGMKSRVGEVEKLLDLGTRKDEVGVVGICGMGGIGKTTLARVLYDTISHHFYASHFLLNASEFHNMSSGMEHGKKILLVLDDVDIVPEKLQPLIQTIEASLFGRGSRIIITTRNEGVLKVFEKHDIYRVKLLTGDEALQLFCRKAFRCNFPVRGSYDEELINRALEYANGLPLAIVKLGSFLYNARPSEWSTALDEFKKASLKVEAIVLDLEDSQGSTLRVEALSRMRNLRLLIFRNVKFIGVLKHLSCELQYISWHKYPFNSLPSSFEPYHLKDLILPDSCITRIWDEEKVPNNYCITNNEWEEGKGFPMLENMNLSGSKDLTKMPNFKTLPYLERLELEGCIKLSQLDSSIASLSVLKFINLRNCSNLVSIPNDLFCLPTLEMLNLACCSKFACCLKFRPLEEPRERESIDQQSSPSRKRQKLCRRKSI